jgi:hypothetical protein
MNRSLNAIANRFVFANRKNIVDIRKAKTNDKTTLHAHAVHALYCIYGSLRGLLGAGTRLRTAATARLAECSTMQWSWMSASQPCPVVRRRSPAVVVVA